MLYSMTANAFPDIHYQAVMKEQNFDKDALKNFLLSKLDDISALIMEIDFFIAGNRRHAILTPLDDIETICSQIHAVKISSQVSILKSLLHQGQDATGEIHYQGRLDHILNCIRQSCFSYAETIRRDL